MSFNVKAILIVRADGSDNNGGGFNPGNANFPTDLVGANANTATPTVSSASYTFVAGDVGARVFIQSGTNWIKGWYTITAVNGGIATITASVGGATLYDGSNASGVSTVTGCATVASPTGGVFGVDYSLQASQKISFTDMVIDGTTNTKFTSAANPVGKNFIGNYINVTSGTGFTVQRVEVVSTVTTTATCDKSLGTLSSTGGNGKLGGALASPGKAGAVMIASNDVFIKSGTYTRTDVNPNVANGQMEITSAGSISNWSIIEGFATIPRDMGTRPVLSAGAINESPIVIDDAYVLIRNLNIQGTGNSNGPSAGPLDVFESCKASNCLQGFILSSGALAISCEATTCSTYGFNVGFAATALACEAYANTGVGFKLTDGSRTSRCLSYANTGGASDGFLVNSSASGQATIIDACVSYGNGGVGVNVPDAPLVVVIVDTIIEANTGLGVSSGSSQIEVRMLNCGVYNNSAGNIESTIINQSGIVTGTASFFAAAASGNFTLNGTPGGGASIKAVGFVGLMPRGLSRGYTDIGAIQSRGGASGRGGRFGGTWRS